jgi:hypothetical protein
LTKRKKELSRRKNAGSRRRVWWVGGLILLAIIGCVGYLYWQKTTGDQQMNPAALAGRWLRPDGGYVLELGGIDPDGLVMAAYFNPRPIHVSRAEWCRQEGRLGLFIELRDVNYPGSTYTLVYQDKNDRLQGIYYQAYAFKDGGRYLKKSKKYRYVL